MKPKYTIMHVNNRALREMRHNKKILKAFDYIDNINFVNGNELDAKEGLENLGIKTDAAWAPKDSRPFRPSPGEYGVWLSTFNLFKYIIDNEIEELLVLEDDVVLKGSFVEKFLECRKDLPPGWSFLSMYTKKDLKITEDTDINSKNIHRSYTQHAWAQCMLYSKVGAEKIIELMYSKGMKTVNDDFIFDLSRLKEIDGYTIRPDVDPVVFHQTNLQSIIDLDGKRNNYYQQSG